MLVIVIGIPGVVSSALENELSISDMTQDNVYRFLFPIHSQKALDVAAVCGDPGLF